MGRLGVRRETLAGVRVAIAGPEGHDVRRMDMLALLSWTLPELVAILPSKFPPADDCQRERSDVAWADCPPPPRCSSIPIGR